MDDGGEFFHYVGPHPEKVLAYHRALMGGEDVEQVSEVQEDTIIPVTFDDEFDAFREMTRGVKLSTDMDEFLRTQVFNQPQRFQACGVTIRRRARDWAVSYPDGQCIQISSSVF